MGKMTYREVLSRASSLEDHGKEAYSIQFYFGTKTMEKLDWLLHERRDFRRRTAVDRNRSATSACRSSTSVFARICRFYDHRLKVTEATLIPRPETEELVEWCLDETPGVPLEVIDIGTGTGAIAISLKAARKLAYICCGSFRRSIRSSERKCSERRNENQFYHGDTLGPVMDQQFDVIISNPPYISRNEWELMDESVRSFEPKMAFAENDGLAIYENSS